jgi:ABC-type transport system involved in cytochrome bd biosynthesis fused ATPase/permease subunit
VEWNCRSSRSRCAEEPPRARVNTLIEASLVFLATSEGLAGRARVDAAMFSLLRYVGRAIMGPTASVSSAPGSCAEGRITIDGVNLRQLSQRHDRRLFGMGSQEALLFNASARENIVDGRPRSPTRISSGPGASPTPTSSSASSPELVAARR